MRKQSQDGHYLSTNGSEMASLTHDDFVGGHCSKEDVSTRRRLYTDRVGIHHKIYSLHSDLHQGGAKKITSRCGRGATKKGDSQCTDCWIHLSTGPDEDASSAGGILTQTCLHPQIPTESSQVAGSPHSEGVRVPKSQSQTMVGVD